MLLTLGKLWSTYFFKSLSEKYKATGQRTRNTVNNIFGSFVIKGGSILIQLLLVPLLINYLDSEKYGIWVTIISLVQWINIFDIGLGNGLKNKLAEAIAKGNTLLAKRYVSTTYLMLACIVGCLFLIFIVINNFANWSGLLKVSTNLNEELKVIMLVLVMNFSIQMVLNIINNIFQANQAYARASLNNFLGSLLTLIAVYLVNKYLPGRFVLVAVIPSICTNIILLVMSIIAFTGKYSPYKPSISEVKREYGKSLLSLGVVFFIIQVTGLIIYNLSNLLIIRNFSAEDVTKYNVAYRYFGTISMLTAIIISPFWTAYTDAHTKGDYAWMKKTYSKIRGMGYMSGLIILPLIILAKWIYSIWIGDDIQIPISLNIIVALSVFTSINISYNMMIINGVGKIKLQMIVALIASALFIPEALFLMQYFNVEGIIMATVIYNIIVWIYSSIQTRKIISKSTTGIWNK